MFQFGNKDNYYGLVVFLLATSNLLQPLMSFGAQHTIIKFFSSFNDKKEKDQFLSSVIFLPLFFIYIFGNNLVTMIKLFMRKL